MMSKPIVLLIHGMGTHAPGNNIKSFKKGLEEGVGFLQYGDFDAEKMELVEYNYSEYLDILRKKFADHSSKKKNQLAFLKSIGGLTKVVAKLTSIEAKFNDDNFLYTHLLDVFIYALTFHGSEIRTRCAKVISTQLIKAEKENRPFHIVAHSLGTKILTDTMAELFVDDATIDDKKHFNPRAIRPDSVWMISNVSRLVGILDSFPDPDETIVNDDENLTTGYRGACAAMFNTRNRFDPFTWFGTYDKKPNKGVNTIFNDIRQLKDDSLPINPHDLAEYFAFPEISAYFLMNVFHYTPSLAEVNKGIKEYRKGTVKGELKTKLNKVKSSLTMPSDSANIGTKIDYVVKAYLGVTELNEIFKAGVSK